MAKACIEAPGAHTIGLSIKEILIGADPFQIGDLWKKMYFGTAMNGRRGMIIHAMSTLALEATRARISGHMPLCSRRDVVSRNIAMPSVPLPKKAKTLGLKAMKTEITMNGPYAHGGMQESYRLRRACF